MADIWMDVDSALSEVPVNIFPLTDDTDFKTRETSVAYNATGMDLVWNFVTTAGAFTQAAVTPTTGGTYDWTHQGDGMYTIEIPASGGASINNDTEGFGWFTGIANGVLPWRGPVIGFRAAALNNSMVDGSTIDVNVTAVSGDTAAADNLEAYCDGTTPQPVNVTQLSGDGTAADNAEAFFDGTGYAGTNNVIPTVTNITNLHASAATAAELAKVPKSDSTVSWNATALAAINTQCDTAISDAALATAAALATVDGIVDAILVDTGTTLDGKIDTIDGIVDTIVSRVVGTIAAGTHNPQSGDAYARLGAPAGASVSADIAAIPTAGENADQVWDEALADHLGAGSTGNALNAAGSAGDPWSTSLPGAYGAGSAGKIIGDNINATISSRSSHSAADVWAVATRTLTSFGSLVSDIWGAVTRTITGMTGTIQTLDALDTAQDSQHSTTQAAISALNDVSSADVQSAAAAALTAYDPPTNAEMEARTIPAADYLIASDTLARVTLVDTCTTNTDMRGTNGAYTGTPPTAAAIRAEIDSNSTQLSAIKAKTDNLPGGISKNVALSNFPFFMVLSSDHYTGATGKTVTAEISKDGGAFAACSNAPSELSGGVYLIDLTQAEMNADLVTLKFTETDCDARIITIKTDA